MRKFRRGVDNGSGMVFTSGMDNTETEIQWFTVTLADGGSIDIYARDVTAAINHAIATYTTAPPVWVGTYRVAEEVAVDMNDPRAPSSVYWVVLPAGKRGKPVLTIKRKGK